MEKYNHSGKIGILGIVYMLIFGIASALIFGMLYSYLIYFIPFPYITFFITLGFGIIVGVATGYGGKLGKIRNNKVMLIGGLLTGIIALYCSWVGYIFVSSGSEIWLLNPASILTMAKAVAAIGPWSIFGITFKGALLYFVWIIEALIIIGTSTLVAMVYTSNSIFCEKCNKWLKHKETISHLEPLKNLDIQIKQFQKGDFSSLYGLKEAKSNVYTELEIQHCHLCKEQYFLTVKLIGINVDKDGTEKKKESEIVKHTTISVSTYNQLSKLKK